MRLVEEKSLMRTQVFLLLCVVLTGAGIQYCANKIDEFNQETVDQLVRMNLTEGERNGQRLVSLRYIIWMIAESMPNMTGDIGVDFAATYADSLHDRETKEIVRKYEAGEISYAEYCNLRSLKANRNARLAYRMLKNQAIEFNKYVKDRPVWVKVKGILYVVHVGAILLAVLSYLFIYRSIAQRTKV